MCRPALYARVFLTTSAVFRPSIIRMASTVRTQPPWTPPPKPAEGVTLPPLKVFNSLTRSKNEFVPLDPKGKRVTWYACGPTVYAESHLGHARNYCTTDIIRRIMIHYFGFNVEFVMNITDVDDKIILRARQQFLLANFIAKNPNINDSVINDALAAFKFYIAKNLPLLPVDTTPETYLDEATKAYQAVRDGKSLAGDGSPGDKEAKIKMHLRSADTASTILREAKEKGTSTSEFYSKTEDILLPWLDSKYGHTIDSSDHSIFTKLTKKYEDLFFRDMEDLNILYPDKVTRVTEFGPQIVKFVQHIVQNGFAYPTSDGSVYFDIAAFEAAGHPYARLEPWNRGDKDLQADGEGALSKASSDKKSDADFALWKSSKPGEPTWESPWGLGRPGWHIECSVMASETLGNQIDIHSGGIDLAFPHHDNELAQSEAYWVTNGKGCDTHSHEWIKYFLHMGHLSIQGHKMSKSLKNFTTIREALEPSTFGTPAWTARSLRIVFLLGGWKEGVEITEDLVKACKAWEEKLTNFFLKAVDIKRKASSTTLNGLSAKSSNLQKSFEETKTKVHQALCDSFNTSAVMHYISALITDVNSIPQAELDANLTLDIAKWLTRIVTIFGLNGKEDKDTTLIGWEGVEIPKEAQPYIYQLAHIRDEVRKQARTSAVSKDDISKILDEKVEIKKSRESQPYAAVLTKFKDNVRAAIDKSAPPKELLGLCDALRDVQLWDLDIYLEDRDEPLGAMVRPLDSSLKQARLEKEKRDQEKREAKEKREREEAEKKKAKDAAAKISPNDMFRTAEFSEWDDDGIPTKDKDGAELPKNRKKKIIKDWERQKKLHEEWLKSQAK